MAEVLIGVIPEIALAKVSGGGWNELSTTPITSALVICFRVELHSAPE
jgi:hypothetical protein